MTTQQDSHTDHLWDDRLLTLLPHRPPMLLINKLIAVNNEYATSKVIISEETPFIQATEGVPSWIGLEYMGQTAALIAGYQQQQGSTEPHLGFLLGTRNYNAKTPFFNLGSHLQIHCQEVAVVGNSLATFHCTIRDMNTTKIQGYNTNDCLAEAKLSVFRKPLA